jgi:hypothetical protein
MEYKVLDCPEAANLKKDAKFFRYLDFNHSTVYMLDDSSYLLMPLNPFGKSMRINSINLLERFIKERHFPDNEKANEFYVENKCNIDNFIEYKEKLKKDLIDYVFKGSDQRLQELPVEQIDYVYEFMKKRKMIKKYKLNFIALLGDCLIKRYEAEGLKWGLLANKQLLNPVINLILIADQKQGIYFNIEESIFGKYSFSGVQMVIHDIENYPKKSNEIESIVKIM